MARRYYSSTAARTTLASGVDDTTTTFNVTAVSGWPASYPYTLVIDQDTVNEELVEVSARSGTTLTVTRGVDGTSAVAHDAGAAVNHGVSARDFDEPNAFINGTGTVTETLLASDSVTSAKIVDGTIVNADINASAAIAQSKIDSLTSDLASKVDYALPVNAQTGTTYTFVAADAEKLTTASNAAAVTLTIPPQSSVAWGDDTILRVVNYGAGDVTVAGGSGVTVTNTATTLGQYEAAAAIRTGSDAWTLVPFGSKSAGQPSVEYLIVAGGGGTGSNVAGGGGAGGYRSSVFGESSGGGASAEFAIAPAVGTTYTITVGAGGAAGNSGSNSSFDVITSIGGGKSGSLASNGFVGGSGGGAGSSYDFGTANYPNTYGGSGTTGQGYAGGGGKSNVPNAQPTRGGGGGGAGAAGVSGNSTANGGDGVASSITGTSVYRAGGGGGAASGLTAGSGGAGGGGAGTGQDGTANTGGGGGGSNRAGGSGVVILRSSQPAASTTGSPTVSTVDDKTIYEFTSSGSITW